ncbi:MAG: MBL fold metallo-hydrolase [Promethearchaeota archaeon]
MFDFIEALSDEFKEFYFVRGERNGGYPYSNSLLIGDYLLDTGISGKYLKILKKQFSIENVILSHWHEDHISGNNLLTDCKFFCHLKDRDPIEDINKIFPYYGVEGTKAGEEFRKMLGVFEMKNTKITKTIDDDEVLNIDGKLKLRVIHTPGHTAGHCAFYEINSKIAFFGDMDLTKFPYYATIDSNLIEYENSIDKLKDIDLEIAVLGHRDPVSGRNNIREELDNFKSIIIKRDERILSQLSEQKPVHPVDLKGKNLIYKRYTFEIFEIISELIMIEKHFEKFLMKNLVIKKDNGYILN